MAIKVFCDFDQWAYDTYTPTGVDSGGQNGGTNADYNANWSRMSLPQCVRRAADLLNEYQTPYSDSATSRSAGRGVHDVDGNPTQHDYLGAWNPTNRNDGISTTLSTYFDGFGMMPAGLAVVLSEIGSPTELWITFDWHPLSIYGGSYTSATVDGNEGSGGRNKSHLIRWGNMTFKLISTSTSGARTHYTFGVYNGTTLKDSFTFFQDSADWVFFRVHLKRHATTGLMTAQCAGGLAEYSGEDTTGNDVNNNPAYLFFSSQGMSNVGADPFVFGKIDNFLVDNAAFPTGRPRTRAYTLALTSSTGASASGASSIVEALSGTGKVLFEDTGSNAVFSANADSESAFDIAGYLGFNLHVYGSTTTAVDGARQLKLTIDATDGTVGQTRSFPSYPTVDWFMEGIYGVNLADITMTIVA